MNEKIIEFLNKNPLWKFESQLANVTKSLTKDTPIYITGVSGPQGKTTLKNLLIEDGYTNVLELEEVFNESIEETTNYLKARRKSYTDAQFSRMVNNCFEDKNTKYIEKYLKEGLVINFGERTLELWTLAIHWQLKGTLCKRIRSDV